MGLLVGICGGLLVVAILVMYERTKRYHIRQAILLELRNVYPASLIGNQLWVRVLARVGDIATPASCFTCAEELAAEGLIRSIRLTEDASPDLRMVRYELAGWRMISPPQSAPLNVGGAKALGLGGEA